MKYIHAPAKHRRSGTTMQKMKSRRDIARHDAARTVIDGYPVETAFTSMEDINEYLSKDKITCLLCGKQYKMLAPHIKRIHGIDAEDYKVKYGIPQNRGLANVDFLHAHSASMRENPNRMTQIRRLSATREKTTYPHRNKRAAILIELAKKNLSKINSEPKSKIFIDFSWHISMARAHFNYKQQPVPDGLASWRTFKRRLYEDGDLRSAFKKVRAERTAALANEREHEHD